jgi:hypothetical protein
LVRSSSAFRIVALSQRTTARLLLGSVLCVLALVATCGLASAASSTTSSGNFSAHLTKKSFTSSQASSVKLIYKFSAPSTSFYYLLNRGYDPRGSLGVDIKRVTKSGNFSGTKTMTVKKLFAGSAIKIGSYELKLGGDGGGKTLFFRVISGAASTCPPKCG